MKCCLLLLWLLFSTSHVFSGVEMVSLYFEEGTAKPTGYTVQKMEDFQKLLANYTVQFIEINAFSDASGSTEFNQKIASERLTFILNYYSIDEEGVLITNHGKQKTILNFSPFNWERVDLYYFIGEELYKPIIYPIDDAGEDSLSFSVEDTLNESIDTILPERNDIQVNTPIVLGINFIGGSSKIQKGEQPRLDQLYNTLTKYPDLNAHIRGHVCCRNKRFRSRQRAKFVYTYLRSKGIDKNRLSYKGYGNSEPLVFPERTNNDRSMNRRVDIIFSTANP